MILVLGIMMTAILSHRKDIACDVASWKAGAAGEPGICYMRPSTPGKPVPAAGSKGGCGEKVWHKQRGTDCPQVTDQYAWPAQHSASFGCDYQSWNAYYGYGKAGANCILRSNYNVYGAGLTDHKVSCQDCPAGSVCENGVQKPCPVGHFCPFYGSHAKLGPINKDWTVDWKGLFDGSPAPHCR